MPSRESLIAPRTGATSSSVRVRSAARNSRRIARLFLPLADLLAAVEVEDLGAPQELAARARRRVSRTRSAGTSSGTTTARS